MPSKGSAGELAIEQERLARKEYHRAIMELHEENWESVSEMFSNSSPRATKISTAEMTFISLSRLSTNVSNILAKNLKSAITQARVYAFQSTMVRGNEF